jgi:hypothetical protein
MVISGSGANLISSGAVLARQAAGSEEPCWLVSVTAAAWIAAQIYC